MDRKTLLAYSSGHLIVAVYSFIDFYLFKFYTDVVGLAALWVGAAMAIRFVWDALTDPFVGYLSDHTTAQSGRRRPYFLGGAAASGLLLWAVFTPPVFNSNVATFVFLAIMLTLLFETTGVFQVPHEALAAELTYDYAERIRLSAYRKYFDSTGDMLGVFVVAVVLAVTSTHGTSPAETERSAYSISAAILAGVVIAAGLVTFLGTKGKDSGAIRCHYSFFDGMRNTWRNKACRILLISTVLGMLGIQIAVAQLLYIFTHFLQQPETALPLVLVCYFIGSMVSIPLWSRLAVRIGKKDCLFVTMLFVAAAFVALPAYLWPRWALYPLASAIGAGIAGVQGISMALWPDVIEWDELQTGQRREGSYAAMRSFVLKLALGFGLLVVGGVLTGIGYEGNRSPSPATVTGLRLSFALLPAVCLLAGAVAIRRFPITREVHERALEVLGRSNGRKRLTSADPNAEWFH
jgi:GPH family glycoside/pentoside/hexuronide:cation symporter